VIFVLNGVGWQRKIRGANCDVGFVGLVAFGGRRSATGPTYWRRGDLWPWEAGAARPALPGGGVGTCGLQRAGKSVLVDGRTICCRTKHMIFTFPPCSHRLIGRLWVLVLCMYWGSGVWGWMLEVENRALSLGGQGQYARLPDEVLSREEEFTIECWVNCRAVGRFSQVFGMGEARSMIGLNTADYPSRFQLFVYAPGVEGAAVVLPSKDPIQRDRWYHVAAVVDRVSVTLYLDGERQGSASFAGGARRFLKGGPRLLGRSQWLANPDFDGLIDEIRIWNRPRTETEIRQHMRGPLEEGVEGLMGWAGFEESAGVSLSVPRLEVKPVGGASTVAVGARVGLSRSGRVSGLLIDSGNRTVPGRVEVYAGERLVLSTIADAGGTFSFDFQPQEGSRYLLGAQFGVTAAWLEGLDMRGQGRTNLEVRLMPVRRFSGTLASPDGSPHSGVRVDLMRRVEAGKSVVVDTTTSDPSGVFQFLNPRPGRYRIRTHLPEAYAYYREGVDSLGVGEEEATELLADGVSTRDRIEFRFPSFWKGRWRTLTTLDGLAANRVQSIWKDREGFLWFGTVGGLSRFDGKRFDTFGEAEGLPSRDIRAIVEDGEGRLCVGTAKGLAVRAGKRFGVVMSGGGVSTEEVTCMARASDGSVVVGTGRGLKRLRGEQLAPEVGFEMVREGPIHSVQCMGGAIWVGAASVPLGESRLFRGGYPEGGIELEWFGVGDGVIYVEGGAIWNSDRFGSGPSEFAAGDCIEVGFAGSVMDFAIWQRAFSIRGRESGESWGTGGVT